MNLTDLNKVAQAMGRVGQGNSCCRRVLRHPWSTTTSESSHFAPAFVTSVLIDLKDVIFRPFAMPVSINSHGAWHSGLRQPPISGNDPGRLILIVVQGKHGTKDAAIYSVITSRNPGDLEAFSAKIIEEVKEGHHRRSAA